MKEKPFKYNRILQITIVSSLVILLPFFTIAGKKSYDLEFQKLPKDLKKKLTNTNGCNFNLPYNLPILPEKYKTRVVYLCDDGYVNYFDLLNKTPLFVANKIYRPNFKIQRDYNNVNSQYRVDSLLPESNQVRIDMVNDIPNLTWLRLMPHDLPHTQRTDAKKSKIVFGGKNKDKSKDYDFTEEQIEKNQNVISTLFLHTNLVPVVSENFLKDSWKDIEKITYQFIDNSEEIYHITGIIYKSNNPEEKIEFIGNNEEVQVPTYLYKILIDKKNNKSLSFLIPNKEIYTKNTTKVIDKNKFYKCGTQQNDYCNINNFISNINEIEKLAGIQLIPDGQNTKKKDSPENKKILELKSKSTLGIS